MQLVVSKLAINVQYRHLDVATQFHWTYVYVKVGKH